MFRKQFLYLPVFSILIIDSIRASDVVYADTPGFTADTTTTTTITTTITTTTVTTTTYTTPTPIITTTTIIIIIIIIISVIISNSHVSCVIEVFNLLGYIMSTV